MQIAILMDQDAGMRRFLETLLSSANFRVFSFATAELACDAMLALGDRVSVLICDIDVRDMQALHLARCFPDVPVLLTSAWGEPPEDATEFPYLLKPFRSTALIGVLRTLTQRRYASASAA